MSKRLLGNDKRVHQVQCFEAISEQRATLLGIAIEELTPCVERAYEFLRDARDDAAMAMESLPDPDQPTLIKMLLCGRIHVSNVSIEALVVGWPQLVSPYPDYFIRVHPGPTSLALMTLHKTHPTDMTRRWIEELFTNYMFCLSEDFIEAHLQEFSEPAFRDPRNLKFLSSVNGTNHVSLDMWRAAILQHGDMAFELAHNAIRCLNLYVFSDRHELDAFVDFLMRSDLPKRPKLLRQIVETTYHGSFHAPFPMIQFLMENLPMKELLNLMDTLDTLLGYEEAYRIFVANEGSMSLHFRILIAPYLPISLELAASLFGANKQALLALPLPIVLRGLMAVRRHDEPFTFRLGGAIRLKSMSSEYMRLRLVHLSVPFSTEDRAWILSEQYTYRHVRDWLRPATESEQCGFLYDVWNAAHIIRKGGVLKGDFGKMIYENAQLVFSFL